MDVDEREDELSFVPNAASSSADCVNPGSSVMEDVGEKRSSAGKWQRRWWKTTVSCARLATTRGETRTMSGS